MLRLRSEWQYEVDALQRIVRLRFRGFLHALRLVEMTVLFYHHNALQGISSAIAHIERFSVYRKSLKEFISTRVIARNKVLLCLRGFLHAFHLVEMTIPPKKGHLQRRPVIQRVWKNPKNLLERSPFLVKNNRPSIVISSVVERSPNEWYEQGQTKKYILFSPQCPLGQFMERSENSWRSQFMMPSINSFKAVDLLRLRGFLHAFHLVEMTIYFYHHNKIRLSGFYFIFQGKISSTQWISPVKDGFHCKASTLPYIAFVFL